MPRHLIAVLAVAVLLGCGAPDEAPSHWSIVPDSSQVIPLEVARDACSDCIHLRRVVTLGDTVGPGYLARDVLWATRDSSGSYWLSQWQEGLKVYDAAGGFVRSVGRTGQGPMEFRNAGPVFTDAQGRVHVVGNGNQRETVIGPDFERVTDRRLPALVHAAAPLDEDGTYGVNMSWLQGPGAGHPLHVIRGPEVLHSFGLAEGEEGGPVRPLTTMRQIARGDGGHLFTIKIYEYLLEAWTGQGARVAGFHLAEFSPGPPAPGSWTADSPPPNRIFALQAKGDGQLWVVSWERRDDWLENAEEQQNPDGSIRIGPADGDYRAFFRGRVDLVDLTRAKIVATRRLDVLPVAFLGKGLLLENTLAGIGHPQVVVWELNLDN